MNNNKINEVNSLAPKAHGLDPVLQRLNKQNNVRKIIIIIIKLVKTMLPSS